MADTLIVTVENADDLSALVAEIEMSGAAGVDAEIRVEVR